MDEAQAILGKVPPSALQQSLRIILDRVQDDPDLCAALRNKYPFLFQVIESKDDGERPFLACGYNASASDHTKYRSPWTNNLHSVVLDDKPKDSGVGVETEEEAIAKDDNGENTVTDTVDEGDGPNDTATDGNGENIDSTVSVAVDEGDGPNDGNPVDQATPKVEVPDEDDELRPLEVTFNEVWDAYKNLYYGHESAGSVYLKKSEAYSFEGLFGIHKKVASGSWKSASLVRVHEPSEKECTYTVETFVCLTLDPLGSTDQESALPTSADISLTTSKEVTRSCKIQTDKGIPINVSHIEHIGTLIESNEIDLRSNLERVLIPKNQEILDTIQKKRISRPQVNPLMGMVMNSDVLKKKLAKAASTNE
jgi:F-actin capping protein, beta subunit